MEKTGVSIAAFPFDELPRVERSHVLSDHAGRKTARALFDEIVFQTELANMLGVAVTIAARMPSQRTEPSSDGAGVGLGIVIESVPPRGFIVECERALSIDVVARALGRPESTWTMHATTAAAEEVCGALAGVAATALRRASRDFGVRVTMATAALRATHEAVAEVGYAWVWPLDITVGTATYCARVWAPASTPWLDGSGPPIREASRIPIALAVFAPVALEPTDMASLKVGDWISVPSLSKEGAEGLSATRVGLASGAREDGFAAEICNGSVRFLGERATFSWSNDVLDTGEAMTDMAQTTDGGVLNDVPLIGRVELGTVEMTAAEWTNLARGTVVLTGSRVNDAVTLRVSGSTVARGELVVVDGEIGVRISEIAK